MNHQQLIEKIVKSAIRSGADEAEVYLEITRDLELSVRNNDIENAKQRTIKGLGLTVFKDKRLGFSYTTDFSETAIQDTVKRTIQLAEVTDPKPWNGLPDYSDEGTLPELDLYDPSILTIPMEKKVEISKKLEKIAMAYDKRITKSYGSSFSDWDYEKYIANSKGISRKYKTTNMYYSVSVIAGEGDDMQSGGWGTNKRHQKDLEDIEFVAKEAGRRAVEKLGAKPVETQKVPVIYSRDASPGFWGGILNSMNGDTVFKKSTFLTDYLNKPITSKLITLIDDPTIPRNISSMPFDGEGKITRKNTLIEKGELKMFIYDTITARKANVKVNTLTSRRGFRSFPFASTLNVICQNGTTPYKEMVKSISNGFLVTGLRGRGTQTATGNYSCGASGFWIKDGEIAFPVDGVTLGGNALDLMKNVTAVADDQDIEKRFNYPSFMISEMTVGGKGN